MRLLKTAAAPLLSADTYTRWVYLLLGGVLLVPFAMAVLVLLTIAAPMDAAEAQSPFRAGPAALAAAALGCGLAFIPGVYTQLVHLARLLVGGPLADQPAVRTPGAAARARAAAWTFLHFTVGLAVCLLTMVLLSDAATLALNPLTGRPAGGEQGVAVLPVDYGVLGGAVLLDPLVGAALVAALVAVVAAAGAGAARLAPALLGASAADRLSALQDRADELAERNRLAAELHDSIGHALSVVSLQAGTAARLFDADPAFARGALDAIAEQARTATGELDHVLGLLREERGGARTPQRGLADLERLAEAGRAAGTPVDYTADGPVGGVPAVLSRELYRVAQEGLTNALKHGADGVAVQIRVAVGGGTARVVVANAVGGRGRARAKQGGRGLAGAAERVRLLGGTLCSGARDGTWTLRAEVPLPAATASGRTGGGVDGAAEGSEAEDR